MTSKKSNEVLSAVQVLVQHLCTKCPERAEYRGIVAKVRDWNQVNDDKTLVGGWEMR